VTLFASRISLMKKTTLGPRRYIDTQGIDIVRGSYFLWGPIFCGYKVSHKKIGPTISNTFGYQCISTRSYFYEVPYGFNCNNFLRIIHITHLLNFQKDNHYLRILIFQIVLLQVSLNISLHPLPKLELFLVFFLLLPVVSYTLDHSRIQ